MTEPAMSPYQSAAVPTAPAGTRTGTVWIWLIVLLPLIGIVSLFTIDWAGYLNSILANPTSVSSMLSLYISPGYLFTVLSSWLLYGLTVVFAALDVRELKRRGVPLPFHWAFAFLGVVVYTIGRSVVVKRRTGGGLGPLWALIAVFVVSIIASIVLFALIANWVFATLPSYIPSYTAS